MKIKHLFFICLVLTQLACSAQAILLEGTTWKVVDYLKLQGIVSSSFEEAITKVGLKVIYTSNGIHVGEHFFKIKKVVHDTIDEKMLWKETAGSSSRPLTFKDLGFLGKFLEVIEYKVEGGRDIGLYLFIIDNNTMISNWHGIYYILKRQK